MSVLIIVLMIDKKALLKKISGVQEVNTKELSREFNVDEKGIIKACKELEREDLIISYTRYYEGDGFVVEATDKGRMSVSKKPGKK